MGEGKGAKGEGCCFHHLIAGGNVVMYEWSP